MNKETREELERQLGGHVPERFVDDDTPPKEPRGDYQVPESRSQERPPNRPSRWYGLPPLWELYRGEMIEPSGHF